MLIPIIWGLSALGPTLVVVYFGLRAARNSSGWAKGAYRDRVSPLGWVEPGLVMASSSALAAKYHLSGISAALYCVVPLLAFWTSSNVFSVIVWRRRDGSVIRRIISHLRFFSTGMGQVAGMTAYLLVVAWASPYRFAEARGIGLVVGAFVAGYLGDLVIGRVAGYHGEIKMLAPCELTSRAAEIARRVGAALKGVLVLRKLPYSCIRICDTMPRADVAWRTAEPRRHAHRMGDLRRRCWTGERRRAAESLRWRMVPCVHSENGFSEPWSDSRWSRYACRVSLRLVAVAPWPSDRARHIARAQGKVWS